MFKRRALFYGGFGLVLGLWLLHLSALFFYLYWSYWWFDVLMHTLTGFAGALIVYWVLLNLNDHYFSETPRRSYYFITVVGCVLILALFWEALEFMTDQTQAHEGYRLDTLLDLILASIGAWFAAWIGTTKVEGKEYDNA